MSGLIMDFDNGDLIIQTSENTGMDSDGHMMLRMTDNMAMDMDSGELHFTSSWKNDE